MALVEGLSGVRRSGVTNSTLGGGAEDLCGAKSRTVAMMLPDGPRRLLCLGFRAELIYIYTYIYMHVCTHIIHTKFSASSRDGQGLVHPSVPKVRWACPQLRWKT